MRTVARGCCDPATAVRPRLRLWPGRGGGRGGGACPPEVGVIGISLPCPKPSAAAGPGFAARL